MNARYERVNTSERETRIENSREKREKERRDGWMIEVGGARIASKLVRSGLRFI